MKFTSTIQTLSESIELNKSLKGNNLTVPVILYNDKNEIALIEQDNAPLWRVFGNGLTLKENQIADDAMWRDNTKRILRDETNLPPEMVEGITPLFDFTSFNTETGDILEFSRVFALNIGNYSLESKKGALIDFFSPGTRPQNTIQAHGLIFDKAAPLLQAPPLEPVHFSLAISPQENNRMAVLHEMIRNGKTISRADADKWILVPAVQNKASAMDPEILALTGLTSPVRQNPTRQTL